jgi:sulfur relay (sulfurtransferase) DsrF/TusC family protein
MRVLQIVETAYRATLEEQDDTVLWFIRAIRGAGARADVLLIGTAVNYAVRGQDAAGLEIGAWSQRHPPAIELDVTKLLESGAGVAAVTEDLEERGIATEAIIHGVERVRRRALSGLLGRYDRIWKW